MATYERNQKEELCQKEEHFINNLKSFIKSILLLFIYFYIIYIYIYRERDNFVYYYYYIYIYWEYFSYGYFVLYRINRYIYHTVQCTAILVSLTNFDLQIW